MLSGGRVRKAHVGKVERTARQDIAMFGERLPFVAFPNHIRALLGHRDGNVRRNVKREGNGLARLAHALGKRTETDGEGVTPLPVVLNEAIGGVGNVQTQNGILRLAREGNRAACAARDGDAAPGRLGKDTFPFVDAPGPARHPGGRQMNRAADGEHPDIGARRKRKGDARLAVRKRFKRGLRIHDGCAVGFKPECRHTGLLEFVPSSGGCTDPLGQNRHRLENSLFSGAEPNRTIRHQCCRKRCRRAILRGDNLDNGTDNGQHCRRKTSLDIIRHR